ncbi:MAG: nascent polypeptide-associated complex protein [archaeon]
MLPGLNPKKMQAVMKQLGMSQEEIPAKRVIIEKSDNSKITIENPSVTRISIQGQETFQISGDVSESGSEEFSEEDIKTIMEKTNSSREKARETLEKTNDLAEAILLLNNS